MSSTRPSPGWSSPSRWPGTILHRAPLSASARRACRAASPRLRDRALVRLRGRRADHAAGPRRGAPPGPARRVGLREHGRRRRPDQPSCRPAGGLHAARGERRLDADPPLLGLLHGVRPRLRALLRLPELLRLLDAAAGPGGQLRPADRRLGVRRRGVLPADLVLVPPRDGDARRASRRSSST